MLDFTGERFVPGIPGEIVYEHWHRYAFAQTLARGRRVLDVACGEGYGGALLAASALSVTGIDISDEAVQHASERYGNAHPNLRFLQASAASLPLEDHSIDVIVSFETIEHLPQSLQAPMIEEFARVLAPDGILILSSPNRPEYSPPGTPPNPFHVYEMDRKELDDLLTPFFPSQMWLSQRLWFGSTLWREPVSVSGATSAQVWQQQKDGKIAAAELPAAKYFLVVAARSEKAALPSIPELSLFSDAGEEELKRLYFQSAEVLRLDGLALKQRKNLEDQAEKLQLLDGKLQKRDGEIKLLECSLQEKEALLRYRESLKGWLRLPLSRLRQRFLAQPEAASPAPANKETPPKLSATAGVDIIVPVYNAAADVEQCVASVLEKTSGDYRLILIDDASPSPAIDQLFERWQQENVPQRILLRNEVNLGFTGTANRGMKFSQRDVVLLNSDTIVTTGWLEALRRCVASEDRIGTATPFSNNAEICSYPRFCMDNGWPEGKDPEPTRAALARAAAPSYPDIPTGVGFCLYIKRAALDNIGFFDEAFGAGYGEENDFCMRAKEAGFRNVLCDDAFVVHLGERSFEGRKQELGGRNMAVLLDKHPEYLDVVSRFIERDPLRSLRVMAQLEEDKANIPKQAVLHLFHTHDGSTEGGTEFHARQLIKNSPPGWRHYVAIIDNDQWQIELAMKDGMKPAILGVTRCEDESLESFIEQLCGSLDVGFIHAHNISGCREGLLSALPKLLIPYGYTIHDLSFVCPLITFLGPDERYCGGQADAAFCQRCLRRKERFSPIDISAWRQAHEAFVQKASFIIAPSRWAGEMFERYFPSAKVKRIEHAIPANPVPSRGLSALVFADEQWPTVAVLGAVGPDKGARRLERLVALATEANAAVRFVLIGYLDRQHGPWQSDDGRFLVHSYYAPNDLPTLMDYYDVKLVLYPSAGPETFCYTLSEAWQAGRPALVPPFGALAERMQANDAGWIMSDAEWADEALMLQRILAILGSNEREALQEKAMRARGVPLPTMEAMVAATVACYTQALATTPPRTSERPTFAKSRIRDALGYVGHVSATREANAEQQPSWLPRFRRTLAGRALHAVLPRRVIDGLKRMIGR